MKDYLNKVERADVYRSMLESVIQIIEEIEGKDVTKKIFDKACRGIIEKNQLIFSDLPQTLRGYLEEDNKYKELMNSILKRFITIIGKDAAIGIAKRTGTINIDNEGNIVDYTGNGKQNLRILIKSYERIIGRTALTIMRKGTEDILVLYPDLEIPEELRPIHVFLKNL